jgi:hypothetical protein
MQHLEPLLAALAALALVELIAFVGLLIVLIALFVRRYLPPDAPMVYCTPTVTTGTTPVEFKMTPVPDTRTAGAARKEPLGRSCGHCGTRIKADPVRGVVVGEISYHVYACPTCKRETLLPSKIA